MGYALKLSRVNFASVAVDKVTYIDAVPCTGISLNSSAITVDKAEETYQLIASVTPSNTTDQIIWTSSDENVASVANGVVTVHGIGTATITAACGSESATATVTQTMLMGQYPFTSITNYYVGAIDKTNGKILAISADDSTSACGAQAYHNDDALRIRSGDAYDIEAVRVPYGATKMKYATKDGTTGSMNMVYIVDTTDLITDEGIKYPAYLSRPTFVSSENGADVSYGQAVCFRGQSANVANVDYIYFV